MENLTTVAAAEYMLRKDWQLFSKKENRDTGEWWVILYPGTRGDLATPKFHAPSLPEALESAFEAIGIGGLEWSLAKLDVRMRALRELFGGKAEPSPP